MINNIGGAGALNGIFRGDDAKWFPTCVDSTDVTMDFTTWNFSKDGSVQKTIVYGTQYSNSVDHCYSIPKEIWPFNKLFTSSEHLDDNGPMEEHLFSNLGAYLSHGLNPYSSSKHYDVI